MESMQRIVYLSLFGFAAFLFYSEYQTVRSVGTINQEYVSKVEQRGRGIASVEEPQSQNQEKAKEEKPSPEAAREDFLEIDLGVKSDDVKAILKAERKLFRKVAKSAINQSDVVRLDTDPVYIKNALGDYKTTLKQRLTAEQLSQYKNYLSKSDEVIKEEGAMFAQSLLAFWVN
jgi:carbamoylphosphate synthase small subunit